MNRKEAVDKAAKEYWSKYFGPYGRAWTNEVARRVAQALAAALNKTAAAADAAAPQLTRALIAPIGWAPADTGGLIFEGFFRGTAPATSTRQAQVVTLGFRSEFDANGQLVNLTRLAA